MVEQAEKPINNTRPLLNKKAFATFLFLNDKIETIKFITICIAM